MKGKILKERGITLIALVITIIVLLILAGVTLSIVLHTGIIDNSQKAVDTYQAKAEDEVKQLDDLTLKIQTQFGILDNTEGEANQTITGEKSAYNNPIIPVGFKTSNDGASWKSSDGETVDGWNSGLVIEDKDGNQFVWVPCYIKEEGKENNELVEYKKTLGEKNFEIDNLDQVEKDDLPEGINEESQIETYGGFYIARYEAGIPEDMVENLSPEDMVEDEDAQNNPKAMYDVRSVKGTPVNKKNQVPWNNIDYTQAKANAESMYEDSKYVKSGLLTGTMWDTTIAWLLKTNAVTDYEVNKDSTSWGNYRSSTIQGVTSHSEYIGYSTGVEWIGGIVTKPGIDINEPASYRQYIWLLKTGNTEYTKRNNIYDLAGNLWEWTYEEDSNYSSGVEGSLSSYHVTRGSCYYDHGFFNTASTRSHDAVTASYYHLRFPCWALHHVVHIGTSGSLKIK